MLDHQPANASLAALRSALRAAPAWTFSALLPALLALVLALPWVAALRRILGQHYAPGSLRDSLSEALRFDQREAFGALQQSSAAGFAALALLALLAGVFCAGGWLELLLARSERRGHDWQAFARGGTRHFGRFARVLLLVLALLALASWVLYGPAWKQGVQRGIFGIEPGAPGGEWEALGSEATAVQITWVQDGLFLAAYAWIALLAIHTRARLAAQASHSALLAGWGAARQLLRHPVRSLRPALSIALATGLLVAALGWLSSALDAAFGASSSAYDLLLLALPGLLALWVRSLAQGALYALALGLCNEDAQPGSSALNPQDSAAA